MKHFRKLAVLATVAVLALTVLCSCGKAKTYKFDSASLYLGGKDVTAEYGTEINELYKGATLEFDGKTATITIGEGDKAEKEVMTATKDGKNYKLTSKNSEEVDANAKEDGASFTITLEKTSKGYDLVEDMGEQGKVVIHFVK